MIPDILHVVIPLLSLETKSAYSLPGAGLRDPNLKKDLMYMCGMILFGLYVCYIL